MRAHETSVLVIGYRPQPGNLVLLSGWLLILGIGLWLIATTDFREKNFGFGLGLVLVAGLLLLIVGFDRQWRWLQRREQILIDSQQQTVTFEQFRWLRTKRSFWDLSPWMIVPQRKIPFRDIKRLLLMHRVRATELDEALLNERFRQRNTHGRRWNLLVETAHSTVKIPLTRDLQQENKPVQKLWEIAQQNR